VLQIPHNKPQQIKAIDFEQVEKAAMQQRWAVVSAGYSHTIPAHLPH